MLSNTNSGNDSVRSTLESSSEGSITLKPVLLAPFFRQRPRAGSERVRLHKSLDFSGVTVEGRDNLEKTDTGKDRIKDSPRVFSPKYKPVLDSDEIGSANTSAEASPSARP